MSPDFCCDDLSVDWFGRHRDQLINVISDTKQFRKDQDIYIKILGSIFSSSPSLIRIATM